MATLKPVPAVHQRSGAEASGQPGGSVIQASEALTQCKQPSLQDKEPGLWKEECLSDDTPAVAGELVWPLYWARGYPGGTWLWQGTAGVATPGGPQQRSGQVGQVWRPPAPVGIGAMSCQVPSFP